MTDPEDEPLSPHPFHSSFLIPPLSTPRPQASSSELSDLSMDVFSQALHKGPEGWGGCDLNALLWTRSSWHSALTCHLLRGTFRPGLGKNTSL